MLKDFYETNNYLVNGLNSDSIRQAAALGEEINCFIRDLNNLGYDISCSNASATITKLLWCQLIAKICRLIVNHLSGIRMVFRQLENQECNWRENFLILLSWLYSLSTSITSTLRIHADLNHIILIVFWYTVSFFAETFHLVMGSASSILNSDDFITKICNILTITSPIPDVFPGEVDKFYHSIINANAQFIPTFQDSHMYNQQPILSLKSSLFASSSILLNNAKNLQRKEHKYSMGNAWSSSKLKWMIIGLSTLLKGGYLESLESK